MHRVSTSRPTSSALCYFLVHAAKCGIEFHIARTAAASRRSPCTVPRPASLSHLSLSFVSYSLSLSLCHSCSDKRGRLGPMRCNGCYVLAAIAWQAHVAAVGIRTIMATGKRGPSLPAMPALPCPAPARPSRFAQFLPTIGYASHRIAFPKKRVINKQQEPSKLRSDAPFELRGHPSSIPSRAPLPSPRQAWHLV